MIVCSCEYNRVLETESSDTSLENLLKLKTMTGPPTKRSSYLEWEEYFMAIAFLSAQRSKDPRTQVGACIVNQDKKIIGIGYNGMPNGCSDDKMPWNKAENDKEESWLQSKTPYVCHAELNAVLNKNLADIKGCIIYVALFPCNMCAQIIIQSGISEVIYYSDKYHNQAKFKASRHLLDTAGVKYRQFRPRQKQIVIDFNCIEELPNMSEIGNSSSRRNVNDTTEEVIHRNVTDDRKEAFSASNGKPTYNLNQNLNSNSKSECDGMAINNNNKGVSQAFSLDDHVQHQQIHQVDDGPVQIMPVPTSPEVRDEYLEYKFAVVSTFVILFVAFFSWYLSHCKLIISSV
uniref:dCMP deaminase n=1 Tax=Biomphalaria glabrata TaxID=6526 RepID=A0A2C9JL10_BIOGL